MRIGTMSGGAFLAAALCAGSAAVHADDRGGDAVQTVIRSRTFTIPAGQCPQLPAGVSVDGLGLERTTTVVEESGEGGNRLTYHLTSKIDGTATDTAGGKYRFSYELRLQKPARLPGTAVAVDTFTLSGVGAADGLSTFIRVKVTLDSGANPIAFDILEQSGEPFRCDPL